MKDDQNERWREIPEASWRERLTPEQFQICRLKGTEPAFSGALWDEKRSGSYHCTCCDMELFASDSKFDSGTGWPSFFATRGEVTATDDESHGMVRTEALCGRCGAHLGHVFPDGPKPSGLRYCINSAALRFKIPE